MSREVLVEEHSSTESKIKAAAQAVFTRKGYAATRTRDIASEAGINLALLNYYFRSKENLFNIIMMENMQQFFLAMGQVLNNHDLSLEVKIDHIVDNYITMLRINPNLPMFVLTVMHSSPEKFDAIVNLKNILTQSHFYDQLCERIEKKVNPLHILFNIIGMSVFPFVASPMLKVIGNLSAEEFDALMLQRKQLIPVWIKGILQNS